MPAIALVDIELIDIKWLHKSREMELKNLRIAFVDNRSDAFVNPLRRAILIDRVLFREISRKGYVALLT